MTSYYTEKLSALNLERCYEIAPPRIIQYLEAEIDYVVSKLKPSDLLLELGCGYGRIFPELLKVSPNVIGIDTAFESLQYAWKRHSTYAGIQYLQMNAGTTAIRDNSVDVVICIQNGISAFKVDPVVLFKESLRIARSGGMCIFSTYSEKIWKERLEWFKLQANEGLLGEIDWARTKDGTIVCKDGFKATTVSKEDFKRFSEEASATYEIQEIDSSSLFCILSSP
ncbi:MAG: class I SAM-dependent methyltransferase [Candidatus Thorarchaeota archaeon]